MRDRRLLLVLVVLLTLVFTAPAMARWRLRGAGGCGNYETAIAEAEAGDVIAPMRGGVLTQSTTIAESLVIQGGWAPATGDCTSNGGVNQYDSAAALLAAGFAFDPAERSGLSGDFDNPTLPISLLNGQTLVLQHLDISFYSASSSPNGTAISGVISNGARLRLENMNFNSDQAGVGGVGGAVYLELRGGSQLVISDSIFSDNNAASGGGLEVHLYDGSTLLIEDSTFTGNEALSGNGGAVRVLIDHGSATIRNSTFSNNLANNGSGGAIAIELASGASGPAYARLESNTYSGNSAGSDNDIFVSEVTLQDQRVNLPLLHAPAPASGLSVRINAISLSEAQYAVSFTTSGYTPQLPGRHVHFFFNTVPPAQAGMPGAGPWFVYGGSSPFSGYGIADRPKGATHLCAIVANPDHSVIQETGNCVGLP